MQRKRLVPLLSHLQHLKQLQKAVFQFDVHGYDKHPDQKQSGGRVFLAHDSRSQSRHGGKSRQEPECRRRDVREIQSERVAMGAPRQGRQGSMGVAKPSLAEAQRDGKVFLRVLSKND